MFLDSLQRPQTGGMRAGSEGQRQCWNWDIEAHVWVAASWTIAMQHCQLFQIRWSEIKYSTWWTYMIMDPYPHEEMGRHWCFPFQNVLFFSSHSWWRRLTWTPGTTTSWASIPMACWWWEPLPTSAPMLQASNSCFLASPPTCSCCPFGSEPHSSETTSCVQVWPRDVWIILHRNAHSSVSLIQLSIQIK